MQPDAINPPWYKTHGGIVFLVLLSIVLIAVIIFLGLVGFYIWKIKYDNADGGLAKKFASNRFTQTNTIENTQTDIPVATTIQAYNPTRGAKEAPITIVMFIDFECPFAAKTTPFQNC